MNYTIQWEPKGTIVTFEGAVNIDGIMKANHVLNGDERYYTHRYSIWDFTDCDLSKIQKSDIDRAIAIDIGASYTLTSFKQALVVNDDYPYTVCQLYVDKCIAIGLPWQFKIFTSLSDATEWCST